MIAKADGHEPDADLARMAGAGLADEAATGTRFVVLVRSATPLIRICKAAIR
jgi:hypothetical protein